MNTRADARNANAWPTKRARGGKRNGVWKSAGCQDTMYAWRVDHTTVMPTTDAAVAAARARGEIRVTPGSAECPETRRAKVVAAQAEAGVRKKTKGHQ